MRQLVLVLALPLALGCGSGDSGAPNPVPRAVPRAEPVLARQAQPSPVPAPIPGEGLDEKDFEFVWPAERGTARNEAEDVAACRDHIEKTYADVASCGNPLYVMRLYIECMEDKGWTFHRSS